MKKDLGIRVMGSFLNETNLEEGKYGRMAKSALKATGVALLSNLIPYIGRPIAGVIYGTAVENRINQMHYECKSISDPKEKIRCQISVLNFVEGALTKRMSDKTLKEKYRNSIYK